MDKLTDRKFNVYVHFNKMTNEPFYVGRGIKYRPNRKDGRNIWWKNIVNKYGYYVEIFENNLTNDEANELEIYWISQLKTWGFKLCNLTDGGNGKSGYKLSESQREQLIKRLTGKKPSDESRLKMSLSHKGKPTGRLGIKLSDEHKLKISKSGKGKHPHGFTEYAKEQSIAKKLKPIIQLDLNGNIINKWNSLKEAAASLNCNQSNISMALKKKRKYLEFLWIFEIKVL